MCMFVSCFGTTDFYCIFQDQSTWTKHYGRSKRYLSASGDLCCCPCHALYQCQTLGKYLQVWRTSYYRALRSIQMFTIHLFEENKTFTKSCLTQRIPKLRGSFEIRWVPSKYLGSGGYSKRNCLQDPDSFQRSRSWHETSKCKCC